MNTQFNPRVDLVKTANSEVPGDFKYKLFAVVVMDNAAYENIGSQVGETDSNGRPTIELLVSKEPNALIKLNYRKPVVFSIDLEEIPLSETLNPLLNVSVVERIQGGDTTEEKGSKVVHVATADEDGQPM